MVKDMAEQQASAAEGQEMKSAPKEPGQEFCPFLNKPPQTQILLKRKEESGGEESKYLMVSFPKDWV